MLYSQAPFQDEFSVENYLAIAIIVWLCLRLGAMHQCTVERLSIGSIEIDQKLKFCLILVEKSIHWSKVRV